MNNTFSKEATVIHLPTLVIREGAQVRVLVDLQVSTTLLSDEEPLSKDLLQLLEYDLRRNIIGPVSRLLHNATVDMTGDLKHDRNVIKEVIGMIDRVINGEDQYV